MAVEKERRDFLGMALGGFTALGAVAALGAAKRTWDPLPSVKAAGFTDRYFVAIGLCTHLGCIPAYYPDKLKFICACHGGQFDTSGRVLKTPPPSPLVIPPFKIEGTKIVLGEEGPEYKEMKSKNLIA